MDYFDLLFATGIIGCPWIIGIYVFFLKKIKRDFWSYIIILFTFILIFAGGHVLYAGLGGMMYGLVIVYVVFIQKGKNITDYMFMVFDHNDRM